MTRMLWLLWKVYHNWVVHHKIQMHWFLKVESLGETRCKKSWNQFKGYDSLSLRCVKRVSGKRKDHRLEKYKSKILISEVPTLWNLRTGRLNDSSDVPEARLGLYRNNQLQPGKKNIRWHTVHVDHDTICMKGKVQNDVRDEKPALEVYYTSGTDLSDGSQRKVSIVVVPDAVTNSCVSEKVRRRGARDRYVGQVVMNHIGRLWLVTAVLKCDREPSTLGFERASASRCKTTLLIKIAKFWEFKGVPERYEQKKWKDTRCWSGHRPMSWMIRH